MLEKIAVVRTVIPKVMARRIFNICLPLILSLQILLASAELIDDFSLYPQNNIGGIRSGWRASVNSVPPHQGAIVSMSDGYLIEIVAKHRQPKNLLGKSLRIEYTAETSGQRSISYVQFQNNRHDVGWPPLRIAETFVKGRNSVDVSLSRFTGADLELGYAFYVAGPLIVHRMELLDYIEPGSHDTANEPITTNMPAPDHGVDTPVHPHTSISNRTLLHIRRAGVGISKFPGGVHISKDGHLKEYLKLKSGSLDLGTKLLRIAYSSSSTTSLRLQIRYLRLVGDPDLNSVYIEIPEGIIRTVDIPFPKRFTLQPNEGMSVCILGPISIHRIELVGPSLPGNIFKYLSNHYEQVELVDDLGTWKSTADHSVLTSGPIVPLFLAINYQVYSLHLAKKQIPPERMTNAFGVYLSVDRFKIGQNNLNHLRGGWGALLDEEGLELSKHGFLFQQLAGNGDSLDLTGAFLEIDYSAVQTVIRRIEFLSVVPNGSHGFCWFDINAIDVYLSPGTRKNIRINVNMYGPTQGFSFTSSGALTLHCIKLHFPILGQPEHFDSIVIDNFTNRGRIRDLTETTTNALRADPALQNQVGIVQHYIQPWGENQHPLIIQYRQNFLSHPPFLHQCTVLPGVGIQILENGYFAQEVHASTDLYIQIRYSATHGGTRELRITYISGPQGVSNSMHVVFNTGNNQVTVPLSLLKHRNESLSVDEIRIYGALTVHQINLLDSPPEPNGLLEQGNADALLIDDFANWDNVNLNSIGLKRNSVGTTGHGFITLHGPEEYITEYFANYPDIAWNNLQPLAIRVSYSVQQTIVCRFALVLDRGSAGQSDGKLYINVKFRAAVDAQRIILISDVVGDCSNYTPQIIGLHLQGATEKNGVLPYPLIITRIELTSHFPFRHPIVSTCNKGHSFDTDRFQFKLFLLRHELRFLRTRGKLDVSVHRADVWKNAFPLATMDPIKLRKKLNIKFVGELGNDQGGLTREFYTLMAYKINDPNNMMFTSSPDTNYALQINPDSTLHGKIHLRYFKLIGRIVGMAILSENMIGVRFVSSLYKKIVNPPTEIKAGLPKLIENDEGDVDISELKAMDPELHASLEWILKNDISKTAEMTMTVDTIKRENRRRFAWWDDLTTIDLVQNGSNVKVTEANKKQYVRAYANWHLEKVELQANAFRDGVWDVIPRALISAFNETELELVIAGRSEIDVRDWKNNTVYNGEYTSGHPAIVAFWECVDSWDYDRRARLLKFATGSPRVPTIGFAGLPQKFSISQASETNMYPTASTCINTLNLPPFTDCPDVMCERLELATLECNGEFQYV